MTSLIAHRPTCPYSHTQPGKIIYFSSKPFLVIPSSFFIFSFLLVFCFFFFFNFYFNFNFYFFVIHMRNRAKSCETYHVAYQAGVRSISGCIAFPLTFLIPPHAAKVICFFLSKHISYFLFQLFTFTILFKYSFSKIFVFGEYVVAQQRSTSLSCCKGSLLLSINVLRNIYIYIYLHVRQQDLHVCIVELMVQTQPLCSILTHLATSTKYLVSCYILTKYKKSLRENI